VKDAADAILRAEQAAYLEALEPPRDALLARMEAFAKERGEPISDPEVASFLAVVTAARRPAFIVELGTNIGYGAIVLARAAGPGGTVLTIENSHALCETARGFVREAGLADRVEVREGSALDILRTLTTPIDLAYVDCLKEEYPAYLEALVPRLTRGGLLVADNALWKGLVARGEVPPSERARVDALRAFNVAVTTHPELRGVVLPLGDGVAFAIKS